MTWIEGGVCAARGFRASGIPAEIKPGSSDKDCALVLSERPASVAGMFTQNVMKSPSVKHNIVVCAGGTAQAVFINSGNANAATGSVGERDVATTSEAVAEACGIPADSVCICSTGVIGVPLPMDRLLSGVKEAATALSDTGSLDAAEAIMTTDLVPKERALEVALSAGTIRLGGIAKGSGMISPNMATMDAIISTDATISTELLAELTRAAVEVSFNQISVDNDMSTSDTVLVLANGAADAPELERDSADTGRFAEALTTLCQELARDLVKDGEGATKFIEIHVDGTRNDDEAKSIARAIGQSQLCKTAFFGEDPNWGRFACAAGYAGVDFDPDAIRIQLGEVVLCENGLATDYLEEDAAAVMKEKEIGLRVSVGAGPGRATFWTSDLSHGYVSINADYRS